MAVTNRGAQDPLLTRLLRGEFVERAPVWAMRQAGRWDPEFRKLRGGRTFYEFSENPELSAEASLCPKRFGVDAIILFYDITTLAVAMGQEYELVPKRGPVPIRPIRTADDVKRLAIDPEPARYQHVIECLKIVARELEGDLPILVFAGAPFTLATYQTGIGHDMDQVRAFIREEPMVWGALLERTAAATVGFLRYLMEEGAVAYQLFDSWANGLSREEYTTHCQRHHEQIFQEVKGSSILFVKEHPYVDLAVRAGCQAVSLGTTHDLAALSEQYPEMIFQGNVDHQRLVVGSPAEVREATLACRRAGASGRHILNLDHGMNPQAKMENFQAFVDAARIKID